MLADLVDLVLPRNCVGCRLPGAPLCAACSAVELVHAPVGPLRIVAAAPYELGLRTALIAYKERGRRDLAGPLGALLAAAVGGLETPGALLVPVPSSVAARRERGGDHVLRLARVAARRGAGRCARPLRLVRAVADSAGLDTNARAANLNGAFRSAAPRSAAPAVLVDDITTTGATLVEAARALQAEGWTVAGAAVVAATQRRFAPAAHGEPPAPVEPYAQSSVSVWPAESCGSNVTMT